MEKTAVFISLGSNLGEPERNLHAAIKALSAKGFPPAASSSVYQTEPQGFSDQPWFANQVIRIDVPSALNPHDFLDVLQQIEHDLGRVRHPDPAKRYGPRVIDLDILLFGNSVINDERLTIPHEHLRERAFALVPLLEISPDCRFPDGSLVSQVLTSLDFALKDKTIFQ